MRYQLYLEEQRKLHAESDKAKKRKAVEIVIREVDCKRKVLNKKHPSYEPRSIQINYRGIIEAQFYFACKVKCLQTEDS